MTTAEVIALVADVPDPELPFLTISDLGILRSVDVDGRRVRVCVTPTYSGCPATETIMSDVREVLAGCGYEDVEVEVVLSPAWTTDWLSERGREALREHGIAPPGRGPVLVPLGRRPLGDLSAPGAAPATRAADTSGGGLGGVRGASGEVACPRCGSRDTEEQSRFGSTACKALWRCRSCREPFEHLKQH